ncbi:MAG: tetratricopeptide repeat protein [Elusimicrobia bacterium]|nr:tetratricopeptide repeat protein [Elusimicrobiota bacterium]
MIIEELEKAEDLTEAGKINAAFAVLKNMGRPKGFEGRWYYLNGEAWRLKGIFNKAIAAYESALTYGVPNAGLLCQALIRTAACHRALGREKQAFAFASAAVKASGKAPALIAEAKLELAMAYRLKGDFRKAAAMLESLLRAYLKEKDYSAAAFILWALGGLYRLQGRYALSIEAFKLSGAYAAKARDSASRGYALFGLGGVLRVAGFMKPARAAYVQARKLFLKTEDTFARAYAECGLANVLRQEGDLAGALKGYRLAHRLYSEIGDKPDLGFVEWGLGEVFKKRGEFKKAMSSFKAARRLFEGNGEPRGEVLTALSLANVHYLEGRTVEADKLYFAAVTKAKKHGLHTYLESFT